jgi:predicted enzyme related to lactoylglutathione lyase
MANAFVHIELNTTDPEKAKSFYSKLFDWTLEDMDMGPGGNYTMIRPGDGPGGGMLKHPDPSSPSAWLTYVGVADVNAATAKAKSLGAKVMKDKTEVPGMGWFSIITDPTGAALALWEPKQR